MNANYLNAIDYFAIGAYLATLVVLGLYLKRRASTSLEAYLVGNRNMPWWLLGISGVMDFWDMSGTMIIVSFLYMLGPRGLLIEFRGGAVLVLVFMMLWTGKWHRRSGCLTGAEWMIFRFGDGPDGRLAQLARAVSGIVVTIGMIAYLVKGVGLFLSMFVPFTPAECAFVLIAIATLYTMLSGFHGVVATHALQLLILLAAASTIIYLSVVQVGSLESLSALAARVTGDIRWTSAVPSAHVPMPAGYTTYEPLILFASLYLLRNILFGLGTGDDPKYFAARSDADCAKLTLFWTILLAARWPMMIGIAVLGLVQVEKLLPDRTVPAQAAKLIQAHLPTEEDDWATRISELANSSHGQYHEIVAQLRELLGPDWQLKLLLVSYHGNVNPERVMPAVLLTSIPPGLRSLIVISLIAAAMAGFGAWVNQSAGFFVRDIYQKHLRPSANVHELILTTWLFIGALVSVGFFFAFSVKSINDVWAWVIMGLGSGMLFPQLLPLYWWRANGVGYAVGMGAGILAAFGQWMANHHFESSWKFLYAENWSLPLLGAVGLAASIVGSLLAPANPDAVLRNFYRRTLPFGLWSNLPRELPVALRQSVKAEHRRDLLAVPLALTFQVMLFLCPMLLVIRNWEGFVASLTVGLVAFAGLYFVWLRKLDEADRNYAVASGIEKTP